MAGLTNPQSELYQRLVALGWELKKIDFRNGSYVARASNEQAGMEAERTGRTPEEALLGVLRHAERASEIRRFAALKKLGAWTTSWVDQKEEIAKAYRALPVFDPQALPAWEALANESKVQADAIRKQIDVQVVDEPEPYETAQEMCEDIKMNGRFLVSRANSDHPVWSPADNINFRIVHDVIGHCQSGGDFSWRGENMACGVHFPLVSPLAQEALFTECIGQTAYYSFYRGFGSQKVGLMSELLKPAQEAEGTQVWIPHGNFMSQEQQEQEMVRREDEARQKAVYDQEMQTGLAPSPVFELPTVSDGWKAKPAPAFKPKRTHWKEAMPVVRPKNVDSYLEGIVGPGELHANPDRRRTGIYCDNPKCMYEMTFDDYEQAEFGGGFTCPECGYTMVLDPNKVKRDTRAGLSLKAFGDIGEAVIEKLGAIEGLGTFTPASDSYNYAIDYILEGTDGVRYGVEVKANHSEAQERFKIGGAEERKKKLEYCEANGLQPALVGVRLNFYTDRADVFFRPGLTDTWMGNSKMLHVATADFSEFNPFKAPTPEQQKQNVDAADIPDTSLAEDDIPWGQATASAWREVTAARDPDYAFVWYGGELRVQPYHRNFRFRGALERMMREFGVDMRHSMMDLDPTQVAAGTIWVYPDGEYRVEHKQLSNPQVRREAEADIDRRASEWLDVVGAAPY